MQRLAAHKREPITALLPKPPLTSPSFTWPHDLPTRTIVLFLDRVEENWGFAAPEGKEKIEALAAGDLRGWLPQAVAHLEERFKGSDFRVIATVRDDPTELWERIEPESPFWRSFTVYRLPDWEESQREELCRRDERFAWQREQEVEGRHGLKWVESWVIEEKDILKCPEAYLEGRGDLRANAALLTDLLLAASREEEHMEELLPSLFNLGFTLQAELADLEGAIKAYSRVVELDPRDHAAFNNRGIAYRKKSELVEEREERLSLLDLAIADFTEAIGIKPDIEAAFYNRGLAYAEKADLVKKPEERLSLLDLAIEDCTEAIELAKDERAKAMYLRNRADTYIELGRLEEVGDDLERARELDPENPYLFARYGQLHLWRGEFEQAIAMCREAQERGLKEVEVQFNLALATLCQGRLEEAKKEYGRGVEMADREDLEGAIEDLERMLARRPGLERTGEVLEMLHEAKAQRT